jgi:hypothetical protein
MQGRIQVVLEVQLRAAVFFHERRKFRRITKLFLRLEEEAVIERRSDHGTHHQPQAEQHTHA